MFFNNQNNDISRNEDNPMLILTQNTNSQMINLN